MSESFTIVPSAPSDPLLKRFVNAFLAAWNDGSLSDLESLLATDYHRRSSLGPPVGIDGLRSEISEVRGAFPGLVTNISDAVRADNRLILRWRSTGVHSARYRNLPGSGKAVSLEGMLVAYVTGERIREEFATWSIGDLGPALGVRSLEARPESSLKTPDLAAEQGVKDAHGKWASGVTVVTTASPEGPKGLVVNAFASLSLEPPLILVCIASTSRTHDTLMLSDGFAVNILGSEQVSLVQKFTGPPNDRFAEVAWSPGATRAPLIQGAAAYLDAITVERVRVATHTVFVGLVVDALSTNLDPLLYMSRNFYSADALVRARSAGSDPTTGRQGP